MPIEYPGGGVVREHTAVRERVGLFDVSHLGKASVTGAGRGGVRQRLPDQRPRADLAGQAQYTMCCDENGGVVDDLIAYLRSDDDVFLIPNAANTAEVVRRLRGGRAGGRRGHRPAPAVRRARRPGPAQRRGAAGARAADRPRLHVVRRGRLAGRARSSSAAPATPASAATSCPALGGHAGPVGRAHRGGRGVRRPALRPGRARHAAHRDGLPVARQRPQPRHHAGPGPRRVGRRVEEGRLLGPGGAGRREGRPVRAAPPGGCSPPVAASRARTAR